LSHSSSSSTVKLTCLLKSLSVYLLRAHTCNHVFIWFYHSKELKELGICLVVFSESYTDTECCGRVDVMTFKFGGATRMLNLLSQPMYSQHNSTRIYSQLH
jgi:hypothetical protein